MNLRELMNNLLIDITIVRLYSAYYHECVFFDYFWTERDDAVSKCLIITLYSLLLNYFLFIVWLLHSHYACHEDWCSAVRLLIVLNLASTNQKKT